MADVRSHDERKPARPMIRWIAVWLVSMAAAHAALLQFSTRPGAAAAVTSAWPAASRLSRRADRPTVTVFLHPLCPCSRATLSELARALAHGGGQADGRRADACVVFSWEGTDAPSDDPGLRDQAQAIPGVRVVTDLGAVEARRFGVATSGEVLFHDPEGQLRFHGGITGARGHEGDNTGTAILRRLLVDGATAQRGPVEATPVFGCPLHAPERGAIR